MAAGKITSRTALVQGQQAGTSLTYLGLSPFGLTDDRKATLDTLFSRLDNGLNAGSQNQLLVRDYGGQVYNVKSAAFGAVGDGIADDTAAIQAALNLFGSATGNTGVIYFPEGTYLISNTLVFQGSTTSAIRIMGAVGATGSGTGAKIKWGGAAGGTMLYLLASNGGSFENLDFDCNSSALYGIWIDATNTTTGSSTAITGLSRAANVVTVNVPGHGLTIGNLYTITITGAVPTTFNVTATALVTDANNLTFSQTGTTQAASTPGTMAVVQSGTSSNNRFHQVGVFSPSGTNSAGVAIGHTTSGGTPQVSELVFNQCVFAGRQILNGSYNGIIQLCAGNTKNVTIADTIFNGHNVNLNFTQASGTYHFSKVICSLAQTMDVSFGSASLFAEGFEVENSIAGATFLTSTGNGASIVLQSCYWLGIAGASDVIIAVAGNLTMLGNQFLNNRTGASVPKIQLSDPLFNAAGADTIFSQGNWFQNVAAGAYIPVVDGSANVVVNAGGGAFYGNKAVNVTSLGDWGGATGALTHLSNWIPTKTLIAQQTAGTPGIAATGFIRMGNVDAINFRNAANSADVLLISGNTSDQAVIGGAAGAVIPGGPLTLGVVSSATGSLVLANSGSAFTLTQQAPALAASRVYVWPTADPSAGQAVVATLGGSTITLSYATAGTGSVTSVSFTGGIISVANPTTTPALTVAGTSGGIVYFSSTTTWASSGLLTLNGVVYGGGAGASPLSTAQGAANSILTANAGAPAFSQTPIVQTSLQIGVVSSASGTLSLANSGGAFLANVVTAAQTAARTLTLPAVGGARTFAFLEEAQTFTALQTFNTAGISALVQTELQLGNNTNAFDGATASPVLYGTGSGGGAYPFLTAGNLVIAARPSTSRDVIINTNQAVTPRNWTFDSNGRLIFGLGSVSTAPALVASSTVLQAILGDASAAAAFQRKFVISPQTASPVTVSATADFEKSFNNNGSSGAITFNLPAATGSGITYTFTEVANNNMVIDAAGTDTIQVGSSVSSAGGTCTLTAIGGSVTLQDMVSGKWFAIAGQGSATLA